MNPQTSLDEYVQCIQQLPIAEKEKLLYKLGEDTNPGFFSSMTRRIKLAFCLFVFGKIMSLFSAVLIFGRMTVLGGWTLSLAFVSISVSVGLCIYQMLAYDSID